MKVVPVISEIKNGVKKIIKNKNNSTIKPIKNYAQYLKEYGLK